MRTDVGHRKGNYVILRMLSVRHPPSVLAKHRADAEDHGLDVANSTTSLTKLSCSVVRSVLTRL